MLTFLYIATNTQSMGFSEFGGKKDYDEYFQVPQQLLAGLLLLLLDNCRFMIK